MLGLDHMTQWIGADFAANYWPLKPLNNPLIVPREDLPKKEVCCKNPLKNCYEHGKLKKDGYVQFLIK